MATKITHSSPWCSSRSCSALSSDLHQFKHLPATCNQVSAPVPLHKASATYPSYAQLQQSGISLSASTSTLTSTTSDSGPCVQACTWSVLAQTSFWCCGMLACAKHCASAPPQALCQRSHGILRVTAWHASQRRAVLQSGMALSRTATLVPMSVPTACRLRG